MLLKQLFLSLKHTHSFSFSTHILTHKLSLFLNTHTHSLHSFSTRTHSLSFSQTHSLSFSTRTLSLSFSTRTLSLSLKITHSLSISHTHTLSFSQTHTHSFSTLSLSLSLKPQEGYFSTLFHLISSDRCPLASIGHKQRKRSRRQFFSIFSTRWRFRLILFRFRFCDRTLYQRSTKWPKTKTRPVMASEKKPNFPFFWATLTRKNIDKKSLCRHRLRAWSTIDIIKPGCTFLWPAPSINLGNIEINCWEHPERSHVPQSERQECYHSAMQPPSASYFDGQRQKIQNVSVILFIGRIR